MKTKTLPPSCFITVHLDTWSSAIKAKSSAGRGSGKKQEFYGIKKLRELILELAVRGLLVLQDSNDEPADKLLKRITTERDRLIRARKIKNAEVRLNENFTSKVQLPQNWQTTTLGLIGDWDSGSTPKRDNPGYYGGHITWLKSGELNDCQDLKGSSETITEEAVKSGSFRENQVGDVLIAMYGATIGKVAILAEPAVTNQAVCSCTPFEGIFNRYLFVYLLSQRGAFHAASEGGAQPNISKIKLLGFPFPLPPLAEQHRIVAKVDELMALCDQLEQQQEDSQRTHGTLVQTLLGALTAASERSQFAQAWQRIASHFDTLFTTESSIDKLKQTILQLAVMGKLVEQDPDDEPASEFLKKIDAEKAKLARAGIIKTQKPVSQISVEEFPLQIPNGWSLARFQSLPISYHVGLDRGKSQQSLDRSYRYFKMNNILNTGGFDLSDIVSIDASQEEVEKFSLASGDLLFNTRNSQELVGKTCVYREDNLGPILYNNNILRARFSTQPISKILDLWMRSPSGKAELEKLKSGTTNVWAIYQGKLEGLICPIPPVAEQKRIVAKVDDLMALCERLKANLQTAQTTQLHLADCLVAAAIH